MSRLSSTTNPFMLMMDPQAVLAQVERSERLGRLQRRVCHPLDKPAPVSDPVRDASKHDQAIDEMYARIAGEIAGAPSA